jgi:hypothetical protein
VIGAIAALASLACIVLSARRLAVAVAPTPYDAKMLLGALNDPEALSRLREGLARRGETCWERDLLEAVAEGPPEARDALIDEQVTGPRGPSTATRACRVCARASPRAPGSCAPW